VEAIRSELKAAAESQLPALSRCRVTVMRPGPKRVRIMVSYVACEGSNIMELSRRLRRVITDRFREMVPLGEGVKLEVEIDFESFGGKPPKEGVEEKKKEGESPPFTGPKYPVDGEV
jgi:hypothetical protein